jgi:hypothetical protein
MDDRQQQALEDVLNTNESREEDLALGDGKVNKLTEFTLPIDQHFATSVSFIVLIERSGFLRRSPPEGLKGMQSEALRDRPSI